MITNNGDLHSKILRSQQTIFEFYHYFHGNVAVAFSGGKDSTVLLHLVRQQFPDVIAYFVNTGLEYPEIVDFVSGFNNVEHLKPSMNFREVLNKYGYPVWSKRVSTSIRKLTTQNLSETYRNKLLYGDERGNAGKVPESAKHLLNAPFKISEKCCDVMKKKPSEKFYKNRGLAVFTGEMIENSLSRRDAWSQTGCNAFHLKIPKSRPLSLWTESDIWEYIKSENISYSNIYDMGYDRTGCMFCLFGLHLEKKNTGEHRFDKMVRTHPKQCNYCLNTLGCRDVIKYTYKEHLASKQLMLF